MGLISRLLTSNPLDVLALEKRCRDLEVRCAQLYDENEKLRAESRDPDLSIKDQERIQELEATLDKAIKVLRDLACAPDEQAVLRTCQAVRRDR